MKSPETARYLKVLLRVKEEDKDEKVGDELYVLEEQELGEGERRVRVVAAREEGRPGITA